VTMAQDGGKVVSITYRPSFTPLPQEILLKYTIIITNMYISNASCIKYTHLYSTLAHHDGWCFIWDTNCTPSDHEQRATESGISKTSSPCYYHSSHPVQGNIQLTMITVYFTLLRKSNQPEDG